MCLIIYKPAGLEINKKFIGIAYKNNPDGCGIMWTENNRVEVLRGMFSSKQLDKILTSLTKKSIAIHFRYRTVGDATIENIHPFEVLNTTQHNQDLFFMHNGTLKNYSHNLPQSDSWQFAKKLQWQLQSTGSDQLFTDDGKNVLAKQIGKNNKMLFLRGDGAVSIVNHETGVTIDGCWYSNIYSLIKDYRQTIQYAECWKNHIDTVSNKFTLADWKDVK